MRTLKCLIAALAMLLTGSVAANAAAIAKIDLSSQTMNVYVNGSLRHSWPVSTARRGYRTPTGSYRVNRMHKMWHSRKYNMSPMPYSMFFRGGYAIHGTNAVSRLGSPASHGCVRLHTANARTLYGYASRHGLKVVIQR